MTPPTFEPRGDALSGNSIKTAPRRKSASKTGWTKPYNDFPLSYHPPSGRLYKKINGKRHYFGYAHSWQAAVDKYLDQKDDLQAGRRPRSTGDGLIVKELGNRFLTFKKNQVDIGEITHRSFLDYKAVTDRIVRVFGLSRLVEDLAADDFEQLKADIAKTRGLVALGNEVQRVRVVFNFAFQNQLIDKPVRYGSTFKRSSKRVLRRVRNENGPKMFAADEIRLMLNVAPLPLKAMIFLGVNCGFGNHDCGTLPQPALDLDGGWIDLPRPKTGVVRRCPLWPELVDALRAAIGSRRAPKDERHANLVFLTKFGAPWAKETADSPVTKETRKLLDKIGIHRKGLGFYALRHTFETIGGESRDQVAVDHIMGHVGQSMASHYRERISDQRLWAVVDHVHRWLFEETGDVS